MTHYSSQSNNPRWIMSWNKSWTCEACRDPRFKTSGFANNVRSRELASPYIHLTFNFRIYFNCILSQLCNWRFRQCQLTQRGLHELESINDLNSFGLKFNLTLVWSAESKNQFLIGLRHWWQDKLFITIFRIFIRRSFEGVIWKINIS